MKLNEFVTWMMDPKNGRTRRKDFNKRPEAVLDQQKLYPEGRIAIYSMDRGVAIPQLAQSELGAATPAFTAWNDKFKNFTFANKEFPRLSKNSKCYDPVNPEYPMPNPRVIEVLPSTVKGGQRSVTICGEGLIPEVLTVEFVSGSTSIPTTILGSKGTFRCSRVRVKANLPNQSTTYSVKAVNHANGLAFQLPSNPAKVKLVVEATVAPPPGKHPARKPSPKH